MKRVLVGLLLVLAGCQAAPPPVPFEATVLGGDESPPALAARISPDGRFAVSVEADKLVVWNAGSGARLLELQANEPRSIAFSQDSKQVAVGCANGAVDLHDVFVTERFAGVGGRTLQGTRHATENVRFTPDGTSLVSWERDAIVWDLSSNQAHVQVPGEVLRISDDARTIVVRRAGIRVVEASNGHDRCVIPGAADCVDLSADGALLALGTSEGVVSLHETASGRELARISGLVGGARSLLFSPDGKLLVAGARLELADRLLAVPTLREVRPLTWQNGAHVFSPDSKELVSVINGSWVVFFEAETGKELGMLWGGGRHREWTLRYSPDGRFLVAEALDSRLPKPVRTLRVFDAAALKTLMAVEGGDLVFTRDASRALWRGADGAVCVGDAPSRSP